MKISRENRLKGSAIGGLQEYYVCLNDDVLVAEIASCLNVPNTGNDQKDYENVRDQVERMANVAEKNYV